MNTNDFSKCKVGDKLWSIQLGDCTLYAIQDTKYPIKVEDSSGNVFAYSRFGLYYHTDVEQSLFFSNPNIIAPPGPPRLPDYKPGQWIAVWDALPPAIRQFKSFDNHGRPFAEGIKGEMGHYWRNHCTLEELPEVLAKWGEKK